MGPRERERFAEVRKSVFVVYFQGAAGTAMLEKASGMMNNMEAAGVPPGNPLRALKALNTVGAKVGGEDGDGVVDFDEFVIISKKFPNILFPAFSLAQKMKKKLN